MKKPRHYQAIFRISSIILIYLLEQTVSLYDVSMSGLNKDEFCFYFFFIENHILNTPLI